MAAPFLLVAAAPHLGDETAAAGWLDAGREEDSCPSARRHRGVAALGVRIPS